jgi:hypothetical protein
VFQATWVAVCSSAVVSSSSTCGWGNTSGRVRSVNSIRATRRAEE